MAETYPVGEMPETLRQQVLAALARMDRAEMLRARREVAQWRRRETRFLDDGQTGGQVTMRIHPKSYHYWGQRLGYACWNDEQFCREYLRDNEYARVNARSRHARSQGFGAGAQSVRFKVYAENYGRPAAAAGGIVAVSRNCRETIKYGNN